MNLRCVKLMILIVGGVLTGAVARADWPDWGGTPLWRWTGYGFGDGYHQGCCRTTCGHLDRDETRRWGRLVAAADRRYLSLVATGAEPARRTLAGSRTGHRSPIAVASSAAEHTALGADHHIMQRTLILLKPDCVQRRLMGQIIARLENKGFQIIAMKMLRVTPELRASTTPNMCTSRSTRVWRRSSRGLRSWRWSSRVWSAFA